MSREMEPGCGVIEVAAAEDARRADRFLADAAPELSRSRVRQLIEAGQVTRDGAVLADADAEVRAGQRFRIVVPPALPAAPAAQARVLDVLFEDADLIVLDKPAGLVVHPAPGSPDRTLVNALLAHCGDSLPGINGEKRPGIVHRLDKDTSGVMVVAKSETAMVRLGADFAARRLERVYSAVCWGTPDPAEGEIEAAIGRDPRDRKRMAVVRGGGRAALTRYRTERRWAPATLLACRLATGRTHQIRVHLAARGHPLVGDPVYLRRVPAAARLAQATVRGALLDFGRQALHARLLAFTHPVSGAEMRFETPLPADLEALIGTLDAFS